jgi:hypothetical protein
MSATGPASTVATNEPKPASTAQPLKLRVRKLDQLDTTQIRGVPFSAA